MDSSSMMNDSMPMTDLTDAGLNMTNYTVAYNFLQDILDYTAFQPIDEAIARAFWYGIVIVIGIAAIANLIQWGTLKARIRAAAANRVRSASPSNPFTCFIAGVTAVVREVAYPQITPVRSYWVKMPPLGTIIMIVFYLAFVLGLEFYNNNVEGAQHYEAISLRATLLSMAQLPLVVLLAGKNNLIGYATGVSYERLNVLHRWVARTVFLTSTIHGFAQIYGWSRYGLVTIESQTDACWPRGFAAWSILLWINVSTLAPIRNWNYEFFVIQHLITFMGFIVAVVIHIPIFYSRIFIYIPSALFIFDRLVRTARYIWNNVRPGRATLTSYDNVTKICIRPSRVKYWTPGQFVLLCIPRIGFGQSHPATIASTPSSHNGDLIFFLRAHKGWTEKVLRRASPSETGKSEFTDGEESFVALIDGPYGGTHSDFAAFDTTLHVAGATGVTLILPILLDIAQRATTQKLPLRNLTFVWIVKTLGCVDWIREELQGAVEKLHGVGIETQVLIFVTCDDTLTESRHGSEKCTCATTPCCCVQTVKLSEDDDSDRIEEIPPPSSESYTIIQLGFGTLRSGRPDLKSLIWKLLDEANGETGVGVCGPLGLSTSVRTIVATASDARGVHKGTGAEGIYLHVECFGW